MIIDISEGTDINKTSVSKESFVCQYWYFRDKGLRFDWMSAMNIIMC